VPPEPNENARAAYIARIYRGFEQLRGHISHADDIQSTAQLLAGAMGAPQLEDDVAPFLTSAASANSSLVQSIISGVPSSAPVDRASFLTFVLGYVLVNAVLEFPGPILSLPALAAYCAVSECMGGELARLFAEATYEGPFSERNAYFQRRLVDRKIDSLADELGDNPEEPDQYTRAVVQRALGPLQPHSCERCGGTRGGYWCPFTKRAVCNRSDCSVASNAWIPRGATLCRVERDYYEEYAPLLGE